MVNLHELHEVMRLLRADDLERAADVVGEAIREILAFRNEQLPPPNPPMPAPEPPVLN